MISFKEEDIRLTPSDSLMCHSNLGDWGSFACQTYGIFYFPLFSCPPWASMVVEKRAYTFLFFFSDAELENRERQVVYK